jgi:hypothetical protein
MDSIFAIGSEIWKWVCFPDFSSTAERRYDDIESSRFGVMHYRLNGEKTIAITSKAASQ